MEKRPATLENESSELDPMPCKAPIKLVIKVYFSLCCAAGILLDPLKLERKVFGGIQNSFVEPFQEGVEGKVTITRKESKHGRIL